MCKFFKKEYITLAIIYFFSHFMLLFVSGRWWDDWCSYYRNDKALFEMSLQLGRPSVYYLINFAKMFPEYGYRWITFLLFFLCVVFFYRILRNIFNLSSENSCAVCLLFSCIPANDARILLSVFPYSIGLFFFVTGFFLFSFFLDKSKSLLYRLIILFIFFLSFVLNSNLVFYFIVVISIVLKKGVFNLIRYLDFLLIPVLFFVLKSYYFPSYGGYEGYNSITLDKLIKGIFFVIPSDIYVMKSLLVNYYREGNFFVIQSIILCFLLFLDYKRIRIFLAFFARFSFLNFIFNFLNKNILITKLKVSPLRESFFLLCIGLIVLSLGLFPYVVVRDSYRICTSGIGGRDSILISFGAALILFSLINICIKVSYRKYVLISFILSGILYFNVFYLSYQQDYYRQVAFSTQLDNHRDVLENVHNIVYFNDDKVRVNCSCFYQLNGIASTVFKNQTRFICDGFDCAKKYFSNSRENTKAVDYFVSSKLYNMSDYVGPNIQVDAVLIFSFSSSLFDVVKLKYYEITGNNYRFYKFIRNNSNMHVYLKGADKYKEILNDNNYLHL